MINTKTRVIEIDLLDDLLADYKSLKNKGESFQDFILCTSDDDFYVWREVDNKHLKRRRKE